MNRIEIDTEYGILSAETSSDPCYPGINICIAQNENGTQYERQLTSVEVQPALSSGESPALRALVWKENNESYTHDIAFEDVSVNHPLPPFCIKHNGVVIELTPQEQLDLKSRWNYEQQVETGRNIVELHQEDMSEADFIRLMSSSDLLVQIARDLDEELSKENGNIESRVLEGIIGGAE